MVQVDGADNVQTFTGLPRATPSRVAVAICAAACCERPDRMSRASARRNHRRIRVLIADLGT
jgi:hypothetical protein